MLKDNPASKAIEEKKNLVNALRLENKSLRSQIESPTSGSAHVIPKESFNVLQQDITTLKSELEAKDLRLLRLKQVFTSKIQEYLEAVRDTLGFNLQVQEGKVKLVSIYSTSQDPSLLYHMSGSQKGHVEFVGGTTVTVAKVQEYVKEWMECKSLPCLLCAITFGTYKNQ